MYVTCASCLYLSVEHMRLGPSGNKPVQRSKSKLFITDGRDCALHGICLIFTRTNTAIDVTDQSITKDVNFTLLDAHGENGHGLLHAIEKLLASVFIPSLRKLEKGWGYLDTGPGRQTVQEFLNSLDSFVAILVGAWTWVHIFTNLLIHKGCWLVYHDTHPFPGLYWKLKVIQIINFMMHTILTHFN